MRRIAAKIIVLFICAIILFPGCSQNNHEETRKHIETARAFVSQNKPESAIGEYLEVLNTDPKNETALFEIAEVYIVLKRLNSAIRYYNLALSANPSNTLPRLRLAQIYLQTGKLFSAREQISEVLEISPNSVDAYHILSGIQIQERDFEAAIETLNKAASIDNKSFKTFIALARLYKRTGKIQAAKKAYLSAMGIDSSRREAYMGIVRIFAREKKFDKVEDLLRKVADTPGEKAVKYTDLARFYEGRRKFELAEENYQKAITAEPESIFPLMNIAEFYTNQGNKNKAIVILNSALAKQKNVKLVKTVMSQLYLHFGMIDEAEKKVDEVLEKDGEYLDAVFQKGKILIAQKKFDVALDYFDKVIRLDRVNAEAFFYRGICIKEKGASNRPEQKLYRAAAGMLDDSDEFERNQVKGNYLAALTIDPSLLAPRINLVEIYLTEGNLKKAKEQLAEIFKRKSPDLKILGLVAGVDILEGNYQEAEKIYKTIIEKKPSYMPAYIRLALLYESTGNSQNALRILKTAFEKDRRQIDLIGRMLDIQIKEKDYDAALELIEKLEKEAEPGAQSFFANKKGEIYLKKGAVEKSISYFNRSIKLKPDYISPYLNLGAVYFKNKKYDLALNRYLAVENRKPKLLNALMYIGLIYDVRGDFNHAEEYYRKVLAIKPDHVQAANNLAFILSEKPGQLEEAFRLAKMARSKAPKDPYVADTMGWVFYQKGNYLTARSELKDSLSINPENVLAVYHMGMILYRTKEYEMSRHYLKKALKMDPEFKGAELAKKLLN